jgi:chloramphenicol-sensitive protein RarD
VKRRDRESLGVLLGVGAYSLWGLAPLFWPLLVPAKPMEVLAHRVLWSLLVLVVMVTWQGRVGHVRAVLTNGRKVRLLAVAAVLVGLNWGAFIWATMSGYVLEASRGYYSVPLLSVALGVLVLKERLRTMQWVAIAIAALSLVYVTVQSGHIPVVGLFLAVTWAVYGYVKKVADVDAMESLVIETTMLAPVAIGYIAYLEVQGQGTFAHMGVHHALLLAATGIVTSVPLVLYGGAVVRAPLSTIGFLQYISSSIQFVLGVWVFHEPMSTARLIGFALTWVALVVLTYDSVTSRRALPPRTVIEPD